jgi:hypothetical protein
MRILALFVGEVNKNLIFMAFWSLIVGEGKKKFG